jgi:phosphoglycolate phosphatase
VNDGRRLAFDTVLFDLDGTLVDSRPGIEASAQAALAESGAEVELPPLDGLLGRPLTDLIAAIAPGLSAEERETVGASFRRHYDAEGWRESEPYPGVIRTLGTLRRFGVRSFVVTNKRRSPTVAILEAKGFSGFIEATYTPDSRDPGYRSKGEMGRACMAEHGLRRAATVVVGDSGEDADMARECGVSFAAASWGYGDAVARLDARDRRLRYDSSTERQESVLGAVAELLALVLPRESPEAVHES